MDFYWGGEVSGRFIIEATSKALNEIFPDNYLANAVAASLGISDITTPVLEGRLQNVDWLSIDTVTDWSGIEKLTNLTSVTLRPTSTYDIANLAGLVDAPNEEIRLNIYSYNYESVNIHGDISVLGKLPNLVSLYLDYHKALAGDISSLSDLKKLKSLSIIGLQNSNMDGIKGSLQDLQNLVSLESLCINYYNITGDIGDLASLVNLQSLDLRNTKVSGDLSNLGSSTKLYNLYLSGTTVRTKPADADLFPNLYAGQDMFTLLTIDDENSILTFERGFSNAGIRIITNKYSNCLANVKINGEIISPRNDFGEANYTFDRYYVWYASETSGNISLSLDFLSTLTPGTHEFTLDFYWGGEVSGTFTIVLASKALNEIFPDKYLANAVAASLGISDIATPVTADRLKNVNELTIDTVTDWSGVERLTNLNTITLQPTSTYDIANLAGLAKAPQEELTLNMETFERTEGDKIQGDISVLGKLPNLVSLYIGFDTALSGYIRSLSGLKKLKSLSIDSQNSDKDGIKGYLQDLQGLVSLESLYINNNNINGNMNSLKVLPKLSYLSIYTNSIEGDLDDLSDLTSLQSLTIYATITGNLKSLSNLTNLSTLELHSNLINGSLSDLSTLTSLTILDLNGVSLGNSLQGLGDLPNLSSLSIVNTTINDSLSNLGQMNTLTSLTLAGGMSVKIDKLSGMPNLSSLLISAYLSGDLSHLGSLQSLNSLHISGYYGTTSTFNGDLEDLSSLHSLGSLSLYTLPITGDISTLSKLDRLYELNIQTTKIKGDVSSLSELNMNHVSLTDSSIYGDISAFSKMTSLYSLSLSNTNVSGNIEDLASLTILDTLSLSNTQVKGDLSDLSSSTLLYNLSISGAPIRTKPTDANLFPKVYYLQFNIFTAPVIDNEKSILTYEYANYDYLGISIITNKLKDGFADITINGEAISPTNESGEANYFYDSYYIWNEEMQEYSYEGNLTFSNMFLNTLLPGTYDYTLDFYWGGEVSGKFTVTERGLHTVTFLDYNGDELDSQKVAYGKPAKAPKEPERAGYHFVSWDKGFSYITEDITVTATYQMNSDNSYVIEEPGIYTAEDFAEYGKVIICAEGVTIENGSFSGNIYVEAEKAQINNLSIGGSVFLNAGQTKVSNSVIDGSLTASAESILLDNLDISGNVSIGASDISMQGGWIGGNLTIETTVADGHVNITGIDARDTIMYVRGGGSNSIIVEDSVFGAIVIEKDATAGEQVVRVAVEGTTQVANTIVNSVAIIEDKTTEGDGIQNVTLTEAIPEASTVELRGEIKKVTVQKEKIQVVNNATIEKLDLEVNAVKLVNNASVAALNVGKEVETARIEGKEIEKITVSDGGKEPQYVQTPGDPTGEGEVNIFDIMAVRNVIFGTEELTGNKFAAADLDWDGELNIFDIMAIRNLIFG